MAIDLDKNLVYVPIVLLVFLFLATLIVEFFGCKWNELLGGQLTSLLTPGVRVIG